MHLHTGMALGSQACPCSAALADWSPLAIAVSPPAPLLLQLMQVTVSRCYGRLYQDEQYKDLFHIPCCDPGQAVVFDLEHTGSGIYNDRFREATLQTAFQYSTVVPASSSGVGRGKSSGTQEQHQHQHHHHHHGGDAPQHVVQRRLRVCTVRWVSPGSKGTSPARDS